MIKVNLLPLYVNCCEGWPKHGRRIIGVVDGAAKP